jgi:hypothetical protein
MAWAPTLFGGLERWLDSLVVAAKAIKLLLLGPDSPDGIAVRHLGCANCS